MDRAKVEGYVRLASEVVGLVASIWFLDVLTHGALRDGARQLVTRSRRLVVVEQLPTPGPAEISALHEESRRITREAA